MRLVSVPVEKGVRREVSDQSPECEIPQQWEFESEDGMEQKELSVAETRHHDSALGGHG